MNISAPFIRRPIATSLLAAAVMLAGILAYLRLPVAPLPRVDFPTINVNVKYPGASPETMASAVAQPLERQFAIIPGISQMLTLFTTPVIYLYLDRLSHWLTRKPQPALQKAPR